MWDRIKDFFEKNWKKILKYFGITIGFLFILGIVSTVISSYKNNLIEEVTYTDFLKMVKEKKVDTVYYSPSSEWMTFTLYNKDTKGKKKEDIKGYVYPDSDKRRVQYPAYDEFRKDLLESDVNLKVSNKSTLSEIVSAIVSIGIPLIWIILIFRLIAASVPADLNPKTLLQTSDVKFDNVIGQDEILDDVKFISELIKDNKIGEEIGAKIPKGILLSGDPGTGKTLIAKAIAGESDVPFIYVNSSSLIELYVGMGAKRVRNIFKVARENSPCVLFFDEIDAIGGKRDGGGKFSSTENDQTINALLQEMDGFTPRDGIFIIAATNRPDSLDDALVRAGRFDRQISVNKPRDWKVRKKIYEYYLKEFKVDDSVDVEGLAKQCSGFTGADIAAVCNEASIIAVMHKKKAIDMDCVEEAIDKKVFKGNRSKEEHFKNDKRIVAYHEAGHAVMNYLCNEPISRASIIGTTSGVGGVVFGADSDSFFMTDKDLKNRIKVCYAGRASEEIKFKDVTTGASNDITQATNIMLGYIEKFGFDENFGLLDMEVLSNSHMLESGDITKRLNNMSREMYKLTIEELRANYALVEVLANKLIEVETLSGREIEELLNKESDIYLDENDCEE